MSCLAFLDCLDVGAYTAAFQAAMDARQLQHASWMLARLETLGGALTWSSVQPLYSPKSCV